jgi:hypothetical protein
MGVRALSPNPKAGVDHPLPQGLDTEIHKLRENGRVVADAGAQGAQSSLRAFSATSALKI